MNNSIKTQSQNLEEFEISSLFDTITDNLDLTKLNRDPRLNRILETPNDQDLSAISLEIGDKTKILLADFVANVSLKPQPDEEKGPDQTLIKILLLENAIDIDLMRDNLEDLENRMSEDEMLGMLAIAVLGSNKSSSISADTRNEGIMLGSW